ncbi:MAG: hypothetical protein LBL66_04625 [Clostridiales bacterium]|nr:hypothetical protein [Clostridiales bacterium]
MRRATATKQSLPNAKRAYLYSDCRVALRAPRNDNPSLCSTLLVHFAWHNIFVHSDGITCCPLPLCRECTNRIAAGHCEEDA